MSMRLLINPSTLVTISRPGEGSGTASPGSGKGRLEQFILERYELDFGWYRFQKDRFHNGALHRRISGGSISLGGTHNRQIADSSPTVPEGHKGPPFQHNQYHLGQSYFLDRWWLILRYSPVNQRDKQLRWLIWLSGRLAYARNG